MLLIIIVFTIPIMFLNRFTNLILYIMSNLICSNLFFETLSKIENLHTSTNVENGLTPSKCPAGYWTEGFGSVVRSKSGKMMHSSDYNYQDACLQSRVHSKKDALRLLKDTVASIEKKVVSRVSDLNLKNNQIEALIFHAYNCGFSYTLYSLIRDNSNNSTISKWWTTHYVTAQGKPLRGLAIRRQFECTLYFRDWNWAIQVLHENNVL